MNSARPPEADPPAGRESASSDFLTGVVADTPDLPSGNFAADDAIPVSEFDAPVVVRRVEQIFRIVDLVLETLALGTLVALTLLTVVNAIMRYALSAPIPGALNITLVYLMPALVFLALPRVQGVGAHISATLVVDLLSPTWRFVCKLIVTVITVLIMAVMLFGAIHEFGEVWDVSLGGQPALPLGPSWLFVIVGLAGAVARGIWQLITIKIHSADDPDNRGRNADVV